MGSNMANVSGQLPDEASSNDTGPNTTGKRLSDRDVEYLSSNPRKKRRQTEQTLAAISATVNQPSAATPHLLIVVSVHLELTNKEIPTA
ncbi:hypothetical protein N0V88_005020 [Collariella sp. IMI 366227]|nr:hypothetical protein N0V88_005020 [Collariella sp. IMI 366227]